MIDVYYWPTPNGHKIRMFVEETQIPYRIIPVNIGKGDQFKPEYLAISPNNRMPAIVDHEPQGGGRPMSLFESGAILLVSRREDAPAHSDETHARAEVLQWLFWQVAGLGPMAGQNGHFNVYAPEKLSYAIERYTK